MNAWLQSRLAMLLLRAALWIMPRKRREWSEAMCAETAHLEPPAALAWARGCLIASLKQRILPMYTGTLRISRAVMLIEAIGCFGPATLAWYVFTLAPGGVLRLDFEAVADRIAAFPHGEYLYAMWWMSSISSLVGPIGLFLGMRYAVAGRALGSRAFGITLVAMSLLGFVTDVVGRLVLGPAVPGPYLVMVFLTVVLPVTGLLHLMHLARPEASLPPGARLATG